MDHPFILHPPAHPRFPSSLRHLHSASLPSSATLRCRSCIRQSPGRASGFPQHEYLRHSMFPKLPTSFPQAAMILMTLMGLQIHLEEKETCKFICWNPIMATPAPFRLFIRCIPFLLYPCFFARLLRHPTMPCFFDSVPGAHSLFAARLVPFHVTAPGFHR